MKKEASIVNQNNFSFYRGRNSPLYTKLHMY